MRLAILIEPIEGNRYRALGPVFGLAAEGDTAEAARRSLEELVRRKVSAGTTISWIDSDTSRSAAEHPLARHAGAWKHDPLFDEYQREVEIYREERDTAGTP